MSRAEQILLFAAARLILRGGSPWPGSWKGAAILAGALPTLPEPIIHRNRCSCRENCNSLTLWGFGADGSEYHILLRERMTPAPWVNILANPSSAALPRSGGGIYLRREQPGEQADPWSNDPVSDPREGHLPAG